MLFKRKPILESLPTEGSSVINAVFGVHFDDQFFLNVLPIGHQPPEKGFLTISSKSAAISGSESSVTAYVLEAVFLVAELPLAFRLERGPFPLVVVSAEIWSCPSACSSTELLCDVLTVKLFLSRFPSQGYKGRLPKLPLHRNESHSFQCGQGAGLLIF
jgi:hypothetical protein